MIDTESPVTPRGGAESAASAESARLRVEGVCKSYGSAIALKPLDLDLRPGEVHALCGHNGAGKSTLVKILSGLVRPDEGRLLVDGVERVFRSPAQAQFSGIALVDQELSLIDELTVADNLVLGRPGASWLNHPRRQAKEARDLLRRIGLDDLDSRTMVGHLGLGQRQLVEIARALGRDARLLILDEPTATLGETEIEHVFSAVRRVAAEGTTVVFVSHRLGEVLALCDRATVLRDGQLVETRATADLDRDELVRMMFGGTHVPPARAATMAEDAPESLVIRGLRVPPRIDGLDLVVRRGQTVALAGQVGCGATDVLRALAGLVPGAEGQVEVEGRPLGMSSPRAGQRAGVAMVTNDRKKEGLFLDRDVDTNLVATRLRELAPRGVVRRGERAATAARLAELVGLSGRRRTPVGRLSGGNQQKVFIGRSLELEDLALLLLDEPTRGVDIDGRAEIHRLVRSAAERGVAVVFASSELDEILDLADVIVTMFAGRVVAVRDRFQVTPVQLVAEMTDTTVEEVIS